MKPSTCFCRPSRRRCVSTSSAAVDVARGDRIGEQPDRIARLLRARATDELGLEPPRLALALELDELAVREADERALADIGVALEAVLEHLRLPRALLVALLPLQRELVVAELLARVGRQQLVRVVRRRSSAAP